MASDRANSAVPGFALVAGASAVAGVAGYAITIVAARLLGVDYATFGVFWSALYFGVGALAGAQQAFAGMARRASNDEGEPVTVRSAIGWSLASSVALSALAVSAVAPSSFSDPVEFGAALLVGLMTYGLYAVALGSLYGAHRWRIVATVTVLDPVLRLVAIAAIIMLGGGLVGAVWAAVLPIPLLALCLLFVVGRDRSLVLDRSVGAALRAAGLVIAGGVAASFVINGIPLIFGVIAPADEGAAVGQYIFAFILVRAPLVVGLLALQSYLVVYLRDARRIGRTLALVCAAIASAGVVLAGVMLKFGERIVDLVAGELGSVDGAVLAGIAIASATTGVLVATGAWTIARGQAYVYTVGWWVTAIALVALAALLPGDAVSKVTIASIVAPLFGAAAHLLGVRALRDASAS
ncbi:hypothetical protein EV141_1121 [Microcella putealis]|uniref:O-antigen/teichoic acid export membrane protein n=1 Tax=Microcella putealis TaxID=337005 RepID=A0A4Q7LUD8_9MICO|nr:hypothetical protein [Microcella putealis]RZS57409.1 hypothetical protein EV141_1121 [Microcella putealis]TQM19448.1 hypothetical protein BJ957_2270 [Microcella putealis]